MAKTTITSADLTLLRSARHTIQDIRLNTFRPDVLTTAVIDSTPSTNPVSELTVTGDVSATVRGQRFIIRDTSDNIVSHGTLRKATSGQTLRISPISIGDSGYVSPIKRAISASDIITIYKDRPLWGDYSRIVSGTFRKHWDVGYTDENEDAPPIANTGASQSARIAVGGSADFTLPRDSSNSTFAFGSKTISSYLWTLPTGVTLQGGYATSNAVIGVTATVGQHVISLKATDSNGKTHTAYTYLFVSDGTNYKDLFDEFSATIDSDTQDVNGRTITFTVRGSSLEDAFLPGGYIHLQHDSLFNGQPLSAGVDVDTFVGYITEFNYSHNGEYGQASITAVSPYLYLQRVYMPSQLITEVSNPSNWTQVDSTLSNPRGALCYMRWQCQNLFSMHDIDATFTTPRKLSYEYNSKTIAGGLNVSAYAIAGNIGSASDGTLVLRKNPNHEGNTFRNALAVSMTLGVADVTAPLSHPKSVIVPYADIRLGGFGYSGGGQSGVKGWYGAKRWAQGSGETVLPDFTIEPSDGLNDVLVKVGHIAGELQYPNEQPIAMARNINVFDPAYMIWFRLNVDAEYDPRGDGWDNTRMLARRVTRTWDTTDFILTTSITAKEETFGQIADEWVIGSAPTVTYGGWVSELGQDYSTADQEFSALPWIAIAWNTAGKLAISQTFTNPTPIWYGLNSFVTGTVCDVCFDYNSAFFTSGYILSQPLSIYIVSASGSTLYIYRLYDVQAASFQVDLLTTYTMSDSSTTTSARIQCSGETSTFVAMAFHDQTGVRVGRSEDGGTTWETLVRAGDSITDTANDNAEIGLYVSGANQVVTAPNSSNEYGAYLATAVDGAFSKLSNSEDNNAPQPMITGDGGTTLYVATENDGTGSGGADYTIDFDGGYSSYTGSASNADWDAMGFTFGGNGGGNAAGRAEAATGQLLAINTSHDITITFVGSTTVDHITFDYFFDIDWSRHASDSTGVIGFEMTGVKTVPSSPVSTPEFYTGTASAASTSDPFTLTFNGVWQDDGLVTFASPTAGTTFVLKTQFGASVSTSAFVNVDSITGTGAWRIDNIKIYSSASGTPIDPALYKVTTYTATDSWTDVTPATDYIPQLPYGLTIDVADSANIELMATNDTTPKYFQSDDTATSFDDNGASDYRSVKRIGNFIIYGGVSKLDLSIDSGATVLDKTGNLALVWSSLGTIKNALVLA